MRRKKRGNREGTIVRRQDGRWVAAMTVGRHPETGKLKRAWFYGRTRQEVADRLAAASSDLNRGTFVAPRKLTVGQWLTTWLQEYKRPWVSAVTYDSYEMLVRRHLIPTLGHLPLPQDIIVELKAHKTRQAQEKLLLGQAYQDHGLVFCLLDGRPLDPRNFTRHFDRMLQQAGLPHRRFHDARHTFTTVMLDLKASPKAVQELLGHSKIGTTMDMYAYVSWDVKQQEMGRLNHVLRRKPPPSEATGAVGE